MKRCFLLLVLLFSFEAAAREMYPDVEISESSLRQVIHVLSVDIGPRNPDYYSALQQASGYIQEELGKAGYDVTLQKYSVMGKEVENIIASIGPEKAERIIVGAHYDTFGDQPGADDNASGIAGLLALAGLLKAQEKQLDKRIDLVAYTLEEPPFFRTPSMGSYVHARSLHDNNVKVRGMISLEMIGYFSSEEDSQDYPLGILHLFYPDTADFIAVVSNFASSGLKSDLRDHMSKAGITVRSLAAPALLVGVDFSDHLNYWKFGYDAVMVTDTAFYRNRNYHQATDTIETLDFKSMAEVVRAVYYGVLNLAGN